MSGMVLLQEIRQRARHVFLPVLGVSALVYFTYHAVQGDRGLIAYVHLTAEIERANEYLTQVGAARQALETDVALLQPDALDRDMLDERARAVLGLAHGDEVLVLLEDPRQRVTPATLRTDQE
jgi:cell division protein FtsB